MRVTHLEAGCALCGEISTSLAHVLEEEECGVRGCLWLRLEALLGWRISASRLIPLPYIPFFFVAFFYSGA
jgi:hypothetical protein